MNEHDGYPLILCPRVDFSQVSLEFRGLSLFSRFIISSSCRPWYIVSLLFQLTGWMLGLVTHEDLWEAGCRKHVEREKSNNMEEEF